MTSLLQLKDYANNGIKNALKRTRKCVKRMRSGTWDHQGNYVPNKNTTTLVCAQMLLSFFPELNTFWVYLFPLLTQTCKVFGTNACFQRAIHYMKDKGDVHWCAGRDHIWTRMFGIPRLTSSFTFLCLTLPVLLMLSNSDAICSKVCKWLWISEHCITIWNTVTPGHHKLWNDSDILCYMMKTMRSSIADVRAERFG